MLTIAAICLAAAVAPGAVTPITVQGSIKAPGGTPVAGTHSMVFRIYDNAAGGTQLWTETHGSVAFSNGIYSATLGNTASLEGVFGAGSERWLSVSLDGGTEFTPRQQISATAFANYSHQAGTARDLDGVTSAGFALANHSHGKTIVYGGNTGGFASGSDYLPLNGGAPTSSFLRAQTPAIANMTIKKILFRTSAVPTNTTVRLFKNGVNTGFFVNIPPFQTYAAGYGSIPVVEGDALALQVVGSGNPDGVSYSVMAELAE